MLVTSIVGARPQFVKLAVICRAVAQFPGIEHRIIHTGQHYDEAMSGSFFADLAIPEPDVNLNVGSGSHAQQTAEMMRGLETVLDGQRPDWTLLYGDTNSTVAGALTAAKLHLKIAHIEAGLRSFNRAMPEEVNRIVADHLSDLLFCPTTTGMEHLRVEGLASRSILCGDVMYDAVLSNIKTAGERGSSPAFEWEEKGYALATIHRAENTDNPNRLNVLLEALERIAEEMCPVVLAIHPRTQHALAAHGFSFRRVKVIPPLAYPDMLLFEKRARFILTDSGGVQKEAYFVQVPCITLRDETEWTETLENRCNVLTGASSPDLIVEAARNIGSAGPWGGHYGNGGAGQLIVQALADRR